MKKKHCYNRFRKQIKMNEPWLLKEMMNFEDYTYFGHNLFIIEQKIKIRGRDKTWNWLKIDCKNEIKNEKLKEKKKMKNVKLNWAKWNLDFGPFEGIPATSGGVRCVSQRGCWCGTVVFRQVHAGDGGGGASTPARVCYVALNRRLPNVRCLCLLPTDDNKPIDFVIIK